jgi:hypothetical protein
MDKQAERSSVLAEPEPAELTEAERAERRERFWRAAEAIRTRNADKDPDEELPFITEVVEEVRQERYERAQRAAESGR